MRTDVVSGAEFWAGWERLMADDRFAFVHEPAGMPRTWKRLTSERPKGQCAETDVYLAAFAAMTLWHGALADRFGRRRIILGALALFALASAGCALAGSIEALWC